MTRARCLALAGLASLVGCGDTTTTPITQLNLDRPVDVSFACYGFMRVTNGADATAAQPVIPTAMPTSACEALSPPLIQRDPNTGTEIAPPPVPGQGMLGMVTPAPTWYAFLLQSSSGTVAVASWPAQPAEKMAGGFSDQGGDFSVLDADPLTPGKNAISIGEDPIAIITDKAGCFEVTANAGSCDLSELEINSALDNIGGNSAAATPVRVDRVAIKNRAGKTVLARPAAMVAEPGKPYRAPDPNIPGDTGDLEDPIVGNACPASADGTTHASGKAFVAFPGCHLVAGIDTADGTIVSAISFDPATGNATVLTGAALDNAGSDCVAECNAAGSTTGGAFTPGPRPVTLDLKYDTRVYTAHPESKPAPTMRLAIGAENLARITMVSLDPATFAPGTPFQIPLEDKTPNKTLGVTTVALSLQIGMGGDASLLNQQAQQLTDDLPAEQQAQFVYAVATDGSVRVADVLNKKHECDTQVDGRFLRTAGLGVTASMCIDNTAGTLPRRIGAKGPGIVLPNHGIPSSVAIVKARDVPPPTLEANTNKPNGVVAAAPSVLVGHFAAITAASGTVYIVNIDDDYAPDAFSSSSPLDTQPVLVMAHQLRDNFSDREALPQSTDTARTPLCLAVDPPGGAHAGGPRVSAPPAQAPPTNTISTDFNPELPKFRQYQCTSTVDAKAPGVAVSELEFGASRAVRDAVYPDLKSISSETWTLVYEGTLSLDNQVTAIDGPAIREGTIKANEFGLHLFDQTRPFCEMGVERYDIADLRGCDPSRGDADCPADYTCFVHPKSNVGIGACLLRSEAPRLADVCFDFLTTLRRYTVDQTKTGELVLLERKHELPMTPVDGCVDDDQCNHLAAVQSVLNPNADAAGTTWSCQTDPLRKPVNTDPARNKRCVQTCSTDAAHLSPCSTGSLCRLNPGSQTEGVCMEGVEPPQACLNGPQRFDIRASEAFTMIGGQSGYIHPIIAQPDGTCGPDPKAPAVQIGRIPLVAKPCTNAPGQPPSPNPCQTTVPQFEFEPVYTDDKCTRAPMDNPTMRQATAIQVSNPAMTLTLVDPTYPGDRCFLDRQGGLGNIPFVNTGYQLQFEQKAGFEPFQLQLFGLVTPVKIVTGPSASLWVIDDGDFVSTSITQSSTRGRVFRVESTTLVGNTLQ